MTSSLVRSTGRWAITAVTLGILAVCIGIFLIHYRLPGLFMDSINPEYLAAKLLSKTSAEGFKAWILPGNMILDKYPVLAGSYYHGPLQLYLSLPVYMIMGFSIESARTAQCLYALAILLVSSRLLIRTGVTNALVFVGLVLLAIDPAFVQIFKTQALSNIWPLSLYLLAILLLDRAGAPKASAVLFFSGLLLGLAFFSYFIYLFFVPVAYCYAISRMLQAGRSLGAALRASWILLLGLLIGALPYFIGFLLLYFEIGSLSAFLAQLQDSAVQLEVIRTPVGGVFARFHEVWHGLSAAMTDSWLNGKVLQQQGRSDHPGLVTAGFLVVPIALGAFMAFMKMRARVLHVINASILCYLIASLPFSSRFGGHHYVMLLPLGYLAWILLIHYWLVASSTSSMRRFSIQAIGISVAAVFMVSSVSGQVRYLKELARTGGMGAYSEELNHFALDLQRDGSDGFYYLPDWGFMMPLQFLTGGEIAVDTTEPTVADIKRMVCAGRAVSVVYGLGGPDVMQTTAAQEERLRAFKALVPGANIAQRNYVDVEGRRVFTVATLRGDGVPVGWCGPVGLPKCEISTQPGVTIAPEPCDIRRCPKPAGRRPEVRFSWDATAKTDTVEVWVGDASGKKLWVRSEAKGQDTTGPWAFPGMEFEVRDARTGTALANAKIGGRECAL